MDSKGWIKLHRELVDKAIWKCSSPEHKTILITLLMLANHRENEWEWQGQKYTVKPGQFITSAKSIEQAAGTGITRQNVRTALDKFEKYEFLTKQSTKTGMLVTITNWELYQSCDDELTKVLTMHQPTANQQVTTNKNDKNVKTNINAHFDAFWQAYPRKVDKQRASKAFMKINPNEDLLSTMLKKLEVYKKTEQWQKTEFIPHPTTWLNGRRWEDEITGGTTNAPLYKCAD